LWRCPRRRALLVLQGRLVGPVHYRTQTGSEDRQLLRNAGGDELKLTPWQLRQVREAIEQLGEERFAEGERKMSEAERPDLYEPAGYVTNELVDRGHLVDQLPAVVAAA
jgi:hypothetical protein